jgi:hypothetical protein
MQITRFAIGQTSKVVALVYFCFTLLFVPFFLFVGFHDTSPVKWFFLLAPIAYAILGYLFTAFACVVYNFVARRVGGIEFSVSGGPESEVPTPPSPTS